MKTLIAAIVVALLLGSTAYGGWYVPPRAVYAYYPMVPAYVYPVRVMAPPPPAVYMPVAPVPVWAGPPVVAVYGKVYVPGRPVRNVVRVVVP